MKKFNYIFITTVFSLLAFPLPSQETENRRAWSEELGEMKWTDAKTKCLSIGMRLPTLAELKEAYAAGITKSWKKDDGIYWSSNEYSSEFARTVNIKNGYVSGFPKFAELQLRCGGKSLVDGQATTNRNLTDFDFRLNMSEKEFLEVVKSENYRRIEDFNGMRQYFNKQFGWFYKFKIENGFLCEFSRLYSRTGDEKKLYESESSDMREQYGDPNRIGFRRSLWKINDQFIEMLTLTAPESEAEKKAIVLTMFTTKFDSVSSHNTDSDMCLDNQTKKYFRCKEMEKLAKTAKGLWSEYQGNMNWSDATAKCKSLGMRLPTTDELKSASTSGITKLWEKDTNDFWSMYWTSTDNESVSSGEYSVVNIHGDFVSGNIVSNYNVRCIR